MYMNVTQLCTFIKCKACFYESVVFGVHRLYDPDMAKIGNLLHEFYQKILSREYEVLSHVSNKNALDELRARYQAIVREVIEEYAEPAKACGGYVDLLKTAERVIEVNPLILYREARRRGLNALLKSLKMRSFNERIVSHAYKLVGRVDVMEEEGPLEIKFSRWSKFKSEHKLQVVWYAIMSGKENATLLLLPDLKRMLLTIDDRLRAWAHAILYAASTSLYDGSASACPHTCLKRGLVAAR